MSDITRMLSPTQTHAASVSQKNPGLMKYHAAPGKHRVCGVLGRVMKGTVQGGTTFCASLLIATLTASTGDTDYSVYRNWADMDQATNAKHATAHLLTWTSTPQTPVLARPAV